MEESISCHDLIEALERATDYLEGSAEELNTLDSAVGDGDMGVTITLGSRAIRKALPDLGDKDIGTIIAKAGMAFNGAAPSTLGALTAIATMRAGREARGLTALSPSGLTSIARAAVAAIMEKGQAQLGDKTLLDALIPSIDALEKGLSDGKSLEDAGRDVVAAARSGVEATVSMKAKSGRAAWITERTAGHPDPGAVVILRLMETLTGVDGRADWAVPKKGEGQ